jgi:hypothetical protein
MTNYKNTTIYFMSGTGNSYRVATWAGDEAKKQDLDCQIIPFERAEPEKELVTSKDTLLGIFLPTHGFTAPWVMIKFVANLPAGNGTHSFVSASRGGTKFGKVSMPGFEGTAAYLLALILKVKGYKVRGVIGMDMPLNWTALVPGFSKETAVNMAEKQKPKFTAFIKSIYDGKKNFGFQ